MKLSAPPTWEELDAANAAYDALPKPYEVEHWCIKHGEKDCDARQFTTLAQAWRYYARPPACTYGSSIFFTGSYGVRMEIQSSEGE